MLRARRREADPELRPWTPRTIAEAVRVHGDGLTPQHDRPDVPAGLIEVVLAADTERASAEIKLELPIDKHRRGNHVRACESISDQQSIRGQVEGRSCGKRSRKLPVTDERGADLPESSISQHVVGMHMGVDDVPDRQAGP